MVIKSYAKINIGLVVRGKRADGFHEIETFFQQISLCDELTIDTTTDSRITVSSSDPSCPKDEGNLAFQAAERLRQAVGNKSLGCHIHIQKEIPMGGGLGGGSSNAASTLAALNELWSANLSAASLARLAADLGSDVPFFLLGGLAIGRGRGEILQPLPQSPHYYGLLLCPNLSISTPWVYQNLNLSLTNSNKIGKFIDFVPELNSFELWDKALPNNLEQVVFKKYKQLQKAVQQLRDSGAFYARMSGSGSTLYGLYKTRNLAEEAQKNLANTYRTILFTPVYM